MFGCATLSAKPKRESSLFWNLATVVSAIFTVTSAFDDVISRDVGSMTGEFAAETAIPLWGTSHAGAKLGQRNNVGFKEAGHHKVKFSELKQINPWPKFMERRRKLVKRSLSNRNVSHDVETNVKLDGRMNQCVLRYLGPVVYECHPMGPKEPTYPDDTNSTDFTPWVFDLTTINDARRQWKIPPTVTDLRLWKQGITAINSFAFAALGETLTSLHLEHNSITYISRKAFAGREMD